MIGNSFPNQNYLNITVIMFNAKTNKKNNKISKGNIIEDVATTFFFEIGIFNDEVIK